MLNNEEKIHDEAMRSGWQKSNPILKRAILADIYGDGYNNNYHGSFVDAEWIEIPPAVRVEVVRLLSNSRRMHELDKKLGII